MGIQITTGKVLQGFKLVACLSTNGNVLYTSVGAMALTVDLKPFAKGATKQVYKVRPHLLLYHYVEGLLMLPCFILGV
jgi:hypothetical protein